MKVIDNALIEHPTSSWWFVSSKVLDHFVTSLIKGMCADGANIEHRTSNIEHRTIEEGHL
jgi:hypothetical protein